MAKDLADLVVSLELQTAHYQAGFDQATARLNKFHKDTGDTLATIGELFAGVLSADLVLEFSSKILEATASLADFSKSAGISVENLSALQFAVGTAGISTEELNQSLKKLNQSASEAAGNSTSKAGLAYQLLGISVKDANGNIKDAHTLYLEIADVFSRTADGANKVALANAVGGKSFSDQIPILDKGAKGYKELADQAAAAGAIIDGPTAEAAKKFTEKLNLLKITLVDGLGAQVEKQLLPTMNALADDFNTTGKAAGALVPIANVIVGAFKAIASIGIEAGVEIKTLGDSFTALQNIGAAILKGNLSQAVQLWKDSNAQNAATIKAGQDANAALYSKGGDDILSAIEVTAKKIQPALASLAGAEAFRAAKQELEAFVDGLQGEVAKLDQGKVAATNYALAHGKLKDALKATGETGKELATEAVAAATKLETIEVTKQLEGLQAQLKALSGDTAGSALDQFDKSVETLKHHLDELPPAVRDSGQAIIDNLKQATAYQQAFNVLQTNAARINQDAALAEAKVNDAQAAGQITSLDAERQIQAIRAETISQLQGIKNGEDSIAAAANQPALTQGAKAFGGQIDALKAKTDLLTKSVRDGLESAFANNFSDLITGAKSFGEAITGLLKDVEKQFADLIAKNFAQQLFGAATGGSSSGPLGGLAGLLGGLLGSGSGGGVSGIAATGAAATGTDLGALADSIPAFADGGTLGSGKIGLVGERGPELIVGAAGGTNVMPNGQTGGSVNVTNHFVIQAPGGQISRPSQMQTAAAVSRSVAEANRRNN